MERWKKGRFKRTVKELSQFDNKKPGELESEFDHFDSYPSSPFKGRNIVDLGTNNYLMGIKLAKPIILDIISKRKIDRSCKHFIPQFAIFGYLLQAISVKTNS